MQTGTEGLKRPIRTCEYRVNMVLNVHWNNQKIKDRLKDSLYEKDMTFLFSTMVDIKAFKALAEDPERDRYAKICLWRS